MSVAINLNDKTMKRFSIFRFTLFAMAFALVVSCSDDRFGEDVVAGEALTEARPQAPRPGQTLQLNAGTPNANISFSWAAAKSGLNSTVRYSVLIDRPGGDFSNPLLRVQALNSGEALTANVTHKQINDAVAAANVNEFVWAVESDNGTNKTVTAVPNRVFVQRFSVGITEFSYTFPEPNQRLDLDKIRKGNDQIVFRWTAAASTNNQPVTYRWKAILPGGDFSEPFLNLPSDNNGAATTLTVTHRQLVDLISGINFDNGLLWRVEASVGNFNFAPKTQLVWFTVFDVPSLFVLGDATSAGWNNNGTDPIELNQISSGVFSSMVSLQGGRDIKFVMISGSWDVNWGIPDVGPIQENVEYELIPGGPNIKIPESGNWIITVDFARGTFRAQKFRAPERMFLVGGSTSADWNPGNAIPFVKMGEGRFELYAYIRTSGFGFKFLQDRDWAGDWGMKPGEPGTLVQDGEDNVNVSEDGFYRIELNFFNMSYTITKMTWAMIGSATPNGWGGDTPMTFTGGFGGYTWTVVVNLTDGEFKFRANSDWGINFGDDGFNGSLEYNGANIPVSAGRYLVELILDPVSGYTYRLTRQ